MNKTTKRRKTPITPEDVQRGRAIASAREAKGWSQARLAEFLKISQPSVSNLERGVTKDPKFFSAAESALGLPPTVKLVPVPSSDVQKVVRVCEILLTGDGVATMGTLAIDSIPAPSALSQIPEAYAFIMFSDDMRPRYRPGELLVIHPRTPPRLEDGVVLRNKQSEQILVREFIRSTPTEWVVRHYGESPSEERFPRRDWPMCHVIWEVQRR